MRIVSQDGTIDTPYELSTVWIREEYGYSVMADMPNNKPVSLGDYSSLEKAIKAMEMLRDAYTRPIVKCFRMPQDDEIEV